MRYVKTTWLNSLSAKVLLAYVAGAALSLLLIMLAAFAIVNSQGDILSGTDVAETTRDMAGELRFNSEGVPVGFDIEDFDLEWIFDSMKRETAYRVLDASGKVVLSSAAGEAFWRESEAARRLERGRFEFEHEGVAMRGATEAVERNGRIWYLQFAASARFLHLVYRAFALPFTGAGITLFSLVLLFVFGPCVYFTLRYTLKPLRAVSDSAAAISPRSLHARLPTNAIPTEIAPLVDSFNRVLERLEQGYRVQQEFLATAAHELKTPLALIRAQIELMGDGDDRRSLLNDLGHMTRQVQQLLLLAEASEAQSYRYTAVDVQEVAKEAASYLQRMADAADVHLVTFDSTSGAQWLADRGALFTLLKNLLENAIEHAPRGTEVRVEVSASAVSVRDWGPGVNQEPLSQIFSRFWRGAHRRDHGAGLGLAICQEIALAHGWALSAHRADPGLRLCLSLPAAEQPEQIA
ncbi:sensor histidine kinase [Pollutimonas bauzanensis]|uniref:histidine kinase n=1 Tax=Pollutimonas bauzanensis TaxID=658167 RepID=A0A1M5ZJU8_9BURK|nr:ATP-binding protein [Pollutimonas bauzanensis]SHI24557.1 Signal transduction histidine kinase [Pollutimonas bauzanensis]